MPEPFDVLVIGAGMAGLAAARDLLERGRRVLLLEAQDRVGGRILTRRADGETIELGPEFVHGRPPELLALIAEAGLTLYERQGEHITFENGRLSADDDDSREDTFAPLDKLKSLTDDLAEQDLSFTDYLDREQIQGQARADALGYVEGFNAADATLASSAALGLQQRVEDESEGALNLRIREGYDRLPQFLATRIESLGGTLRLNSPVTAIRWSPGSVTLTTPAGDLTAPRCLITLPLPLLSDGSVRFDPPPASILQAAAGLRMGQVCRFTLVLRTRFWTHLDPQPAMQHLSFLFSHFDTDAPLRPNVWWTSHPEPTHTLVGWVGGPRSQHLLRLSPEALAREAAAALAEIVSLDPDWIQDQIVALHSYDWQADPFARGAYSYVAVGGIHASEQLAQPVADTLFFAGEHTDTTGNWGTVHAALRSGLRAADQILDKP